jgi:hypothetical protein
LLQKPVYTEADKQAILKAIKQLDLEEDDESEFVILRQNRARLLKRPQGGRRKSLPMGAATGLAG